MRSATSTRHEPFAFAPGDEALAPISPAPDLVPMPAPNEVVVPGAEREQHSETPIGIGIEHQEVAVPLGLDLDLGLLTFPELTTVVDPDPDWSRARLDRGEPAGRRMGAQRRRRLPVPAARSGRAPA